MSTGNSVTPPIDHLTALWELGQPDLWCLLWFWPYPWRSVIRVELVEIRQVKTVTIVCRRSGGRHFVATVTMIVVASAISSPHVLLWERSDVLQLLLQFPLLENLRCRLDIPQRAADRSQADLGTTAAPEAAVTGALNIRGRFAIAGSHTGRCVSDGKLCYSPHLARHPPSQNLSSLLLAEARAREITPLDEGNNVDNNLVLVKDGVDDHGHKRGQISFAADFDDDDDQTTGLENSAATTMLVLPRLNGKNPV